MIDHRARIQQLTPELASQIAAGEVIDRPASIVKELIENAIDAGSSEIQINIEAGGTRLIRVRDNGHGIHPDDLPLALKSHATSKISSADDLHAIHSLGFRGEALASISAVAVLSLASLQRDAEIAYVARAEGRNQTVTVLPIAHPIGTTVEVRQLFYNVPVRRKFLKRPATEFAYLEETVRRSALSRFDIGFTLEHNQKNILRLKPALDNLSREARVQKMVGQAFLQQAVFIELKLESIQLSGWLGLASAARSQSDHQYFFINGRMIRDKVINHAIRQAYGDAIPPGRYPQYVLYLTMPAADVDVNVHPAKWEVRFVDARFIHDLLIRSLQDALTGEIKRGLAKAPMMTDAGHSDLFTTNSISSTIIPNSTKPNCANSVSQNLTTPQTNDTDFVNQVSPTTVTNDRLQIKRDPASRITPVNVASTEVPLRALGKACALIHERYLLAEVADGLIIINIIAALRAQALTNWLSAIQSESVRVKNCLQPLRIPLTTTLSIIDDVTFEARFFKWSRLFGLDSRVISDKEIVVQRLPIYISDGDINLLMLSFTQLCASTQEFCAEKWLAQMIEGYLPTTVALKAPEKQAELLRDLELIPDFKAWQWLPLNKLP